MLSRSIRRVLFSIATPMVGAIGVQGCETLKSDLVVRDAGEEGVDALLEEGGTPDPQNRDAQVLDARGPADAQCDGPCPAEVLATGLAGATKVTVDANNVYFATEANTESVWQCPKTGCGAGPIFLGVGYTSGIAVVGGFVHWAEFASGTVWRCAVGGCGGSPTPIATNQTKIHGVVTDGTNLFWSASGNLVMCRPDACAPTPLRSGTGEIFDLAAGGGSLAYVDRTARKVYACSTTDCASPRLLGDGSSSVSISSGTAFWVNGTAKIIVSCSLAGCSSAPQTLATSFSPMAPIADVSSLYFRDYASQEVFRCGRSGCGSKAEVLAAGETTRQTANLAVDATHVYWASSSTLKRKAK